LAAIDAKSIKMQKDFNDLARLKSGKNYSETNFSRQNK